MLPQEPSSIEVEAVVAATWLGCCSSKMIASLGFRG